MLFYKKKQFYISAIFSGQSCIHLVFKIKHVTCFTFKNDKLIRLNFKIKNFTLNLIILFTYLHFILRSFSTWINCTKRQEYTYLTYLLVSYFILFKNYYLLTNKAFFVHFLKEKMA